MKDKSAKEVSFRCNPRKEVLLVEVSNDWIKLVQAELRRGRVTLSKVHLEPISDDVNVSAAITKALKSGKFSHAKALACLSRQSVNVRLLELPSTDSAEIADMVDLQIGRQTPYSRDEIYSDYKELGYTRQGTYTRVMLAIVQRSIVREKYYQLESAGIEIERMGVSGEGVLSWFRRHLKGQDADKLHFLVDVDSFYSHLLVVYRDKVIFTKSVLVGANALRENRKESVERLCQEIKSARQSCLAEVHGAGFGPLIISGAGVYVDGFAGELTKLLGMKCEAADCLADVKLGSGTNALGESCNQTVSLTGLVGMALCPDLLEFNLVPDVVRDRKGLMSTAFACNRFAALVMTAMVSCSLFGVLAYAFRADQLARLNQTLAKTRPEVTRVQRMIDVIREANRRQKTKFAVINILPTVHQAVPQDVYIESMDIDRDKSRMSLAGTASTFQDIQKLIKNLENSDLFKGVAEEGSATQDNKGRYKFKVVAHFEEEQ